MRILHSAVVTVALFSAMTLAGCGGSGGSGGGSSTKSQSPYEGSYSGQFDYSGSTSQSGEIAFTVDSDGKISGTLHNDTYSLDGTISGTIDSSGNTNQTYNYPTNGTYTGTGKLLLGPVYLSGQLEEYSGTTDLGPLDISVKKQ